jgi:hypothetical protein
MRRPVLIVLTSLVVQAGPAFAQSGETSAAIAGLCPNVDFNGFSVGSEKAHVPEKMWWDAGKQSYFIQGPQLALRFLYPDANRPLSEIKSDLAHIYQIPVGSKLTLANQDYCRPKIEISSECQMAVVPGAISQPAFVFRAEYYDECEQKPVQVVIRVEKLNIPGRSGIQFSFYNPFRQVYDSGMDVYEGENVFNMGYRLK